MAFIYDQVFSHFPPYQILLKNIITNSKGFSIFDQVLDAGCGTGILSIELARRGAFVVGVDRSPEMLMMAKMKKKREKIENLVFIQKDLNEGFHFDKYSFNKIYMIHSLYLFNNPLEVLKNIYSLLPNRGEIILCDPMRTITPNELWKGGALFLREISNKKGILSFFAFFPIIILMGILNLAIQRAKKKKTFHCWAKNEITHMVESAGFRVCWMEESCISNSHLLIGAKKET